MFETAPFEEPWEIDRPGRGGAGGERDRCRTSTSGSSCTTSAPDGTAWNLASPGTALLRASYRDGGPERRLVPTGEVVRLRIEGLLTANRFLPGHRLRVALSGAFYPLFSVNPQTGAQEFESDSTRVGEIRVHSGGSMVILPRVPGLTEAHGSVLAL